MSDLLESGVSIAAKDSAGDTPLHVAAYQGETEMVQLLLLKGADKDAFSNRNWTPLYLAVYQDQMAATLALLVAGTDVSPRCSEYKFQAIHAGALKGHVETLRAVIEHGADVEAVNAKQSTVLHVASWHNNVEAIHVLVEAGANIEVRDGIGRAPFHFASINLHREAVLGLLKHGATTNALSDSLPTPLMCAAAEAGTKGATEVVDSLLRAGADEILVSIGGSKAADVIGAGVEGGDRLAEDVDRVHELLANAPADRVWRRRGYLVLCRAHPDRVQQKQVISGTHPSDAARRIRSRAKLSRAGGVAGDVAVDERAGGDWIVVVAKVLRLQEEGIFRAIVGYL